MICATETRSSTLKAKRVLDDRDENAEAYLEKNTA